LQEGFLHNSDKVMRISSWAAWLSWAFLVLFSISAISSFIVSVANVGPFVNFLDVYVVLPSLLAIVIGCTVFATLQGVSQALLLILDIALDIRDSLALNRR
jgi:hypothetical protein